MAKSPNAFRSISEAAEAVGAPQHVLRFWESKFDFIAPVKRAGGRRFYRPQDVVLLKAVRRLLHDEGLTIKGVQRLHKEQGLARLAAYGDGDASFVMEAEPVEAWSEGTADSESSPSTSAMDSSGLHQILSDLDGARSRLDAALGA